MRSLPQHSRGGEIPFADKDFDAIARIAKSSFGLHLERSKKALIQSRLARRLRALELTEFGEYCALVSQEGAAERQFLISALTTNVTHFYREPHHFSQLEEEVLPELVKRAKAGQRVRMWSAGCSSGQEAYSLAGSVLSLCPEVASLDLKILATDIDQAVLNIAQQGTYRTDECKFPSDTLWARVLEPSKASAVSVTVHRKIRDLVTFRRLNLMEAWPMSGRFDVIMCRNVAIYFDKETQSRLWARFIAQMAEGATLFIGHSERIHGPSEAQLESIGITAYRRVGTPKRQQG